LDSAVCWTARLKDLLKAPCLQSRRPPRAWATFALEWTPEKHVFFVDGYRFYEVTAGISNIEEYLILSMEIPSEPKEINEPVFPDVFVVDYVKVYKKKPGVGGEVTK
jgi:hypothetical protein